MCRSIGNYFLARNQSGGTRSGMFEFMQCFCLIVMYDVNRPERSSYISRGHRPRAKCKRHFEALKGRKKTGRINCVNIPNLFAVQTICENSFSNKFCENLREKILLKGLKG